MQLQPSAGGGEGQDTRLKYHSQEKAGAAPVEASANFVTESSVLFKARQLLISVGQESRQPSGFPGWEANAARALTVTFNPAVMAAGRALSNGGHG